MRKWIPFIVLALVALVSSIVIGVAQAAPTSEICGNGGSGYCINDWNNGGINNPVKMYYGGVDNNNFDNYVLISMCNKGHVSATQSCPFNAGSGLNTLYNNDLIVAVHYLNQHASYCVGASNAGYAYLETCPDVSGNGGGQGTIMVIDQNTGCNAGNQGFYIDRYLTNQINIPMFFDSGGNVGVQAFYAQETVVNATCWGQVAG